MDKSSRSNAKVNQSKTISYENTENKHIFQQIIQKAMDNLIERKNLFVLSDEITNEEVSEVQKNSRIEILLSKMMEDKSLINDRTFKNNINDILITHTFLALSPDSKRLILEK